MVRSSPAGEATLDRGLNNQKEAALCTWGNGLGGNELGMLA